MTASRRSPAMPRGQTMLGLAAALLMLAAPAQADDSLRVLFIGNSYTRFNDLPAMVEAAAASVPEGPRLEAERETHGGYNLRRHWRVERVRDLVANGGFQRVVLQPHSLSAINSTDELTEYATRFQAHASAAGADVVLFQTWARHPESSAYQRLDVDDAPAMCARIESVYSELGEALDAPVAPVGNAWRRALRQDPELELHRDDGTHPAITGTYLSALVLYGTLTGVDPRRVEWRHWRIPRRRAARIRQIAAETLGYGERIGETTEIDASGAAPTEAAPTGAAPTDAAPTEAAPTEAAPEGLPPSVDALSPHIAPGGAAAMEPSGTSGDSTSDDSTSDDSTSDDSTSDDSTSDDSTSDDSTSDDSTRAQPYEAPAPSDVDE